MIQKLLGGGQSNTSTKAELEQATQESAAYKDLLVELQFSQVLVTREYQKLVQEKEAEIRQLAALLETDGGKSGDAASSSSSSLGDKKNAPSTPKSETNNNNNSALDSSDVTSTPSPSRDFFGRSPKPQPLHELSSQDLRLVLREWESKMKANILEKTEALAEARIHRSALEETRVQMSNLKDKIKELEEKIRRQALSRADHEAAMDKLMLIVDSIKLENAALKEKASSDSKTLQLLAAASSPSSPSLTGGGTTSTSMSPGSPKKSSSSSPQQQRHHSSLVILDDAAIQAMKDELSQAREALSKSESTILAAEETRNEAIREREEAEAERDSAKKALDEALAAVEEWKGKWEKLQNDYVMLSELNLKRTNELQEALREREEEIARLVETARVAAAEAEAEAGKQKSAAATELATLRATQAEELSRLKAEAASEAARLTATLETERRGTAERLAVETEKIRKAAEENAAEAIRRARELHEEEVRKLTTRAEEFKAMYARETELRRAAHDELMEMRGNIRVFARVRPVVPGEAERLTAKEAAVVCEFPDESGGRDVVVTRRDEGTRNRFEFDRAFGPGASQAEVFEAVKGLAISALDGYNICLFAYGQTGSGKTHTMRGTPADPGVDARALQLIFSTKEQRVSSGYSYSLSVSVLEIYLEGIYDLLGEGPASSTELDVKMHPDNKKVYVPNLTRRAVNSAEEAEALLKVAEGNRTVGAHRMNEHSSRSHLVFTLFCSAKTPAGVSLESALNLVDLAGSERLSKTEATGERLKEAQAINKSLSALGDVIMALGERGRAGGHVPYRNSKLTYLLSDSLGGSAKVAFFANCSPIEWNAPETLNTLRFAERCRKTELGAAKKNETPAKMSSSASSSIVSPTKPLSSSSSSGPVGSASKRTQEEMLKERDDEESA